MSYKTIADRTHKCPDILENGVYFIIRIEKNLHPTSDVIVFETSVSPVHKTTLNFRFQKPTVVFVFGNAVYVCTGGKSGVKKYPFSKKSGYLLTRSQSVLVKGEFILYHVFSSCKSV